jgi:hypothetical protein
MKKKLIPDSELKEFARFCEKHDDINEDYFEAYVKAKDKSLSRFM